MKTIAGENPGPISSSRAAWTDRPHVLLWILLFLALFLLLPRIGEGVLENYDDCYYAQKAKELLASRDLLTIRYAGRVRFDNPPMFIWMIASSFELFGMTKFAAVFVSAVAGIVTVLLTYRIGSYFFSPHLAFLSSALLLATPYFVRHGRRAMVDMPLAMFYALAFVFFLEGVRSRERGRRPYWFLAGGAAVGAAILTKSILGVLPLVVVLLFLLFSGRGRVILHPLFGGGVAVALLLPLVWYLPQYASYGSTFLEAHFGELIWKRAVVGRYEHRWYVHLGYLWAMSREAWPGVPLFFAGIFHHARSLLRAKSGSGHERTIGEGFGRRDGSIFVLVWALVPLVVLSFAKEGMLRYLIPAFPAFAMGGATIFENVLSGPAKSARAVRFVTIILAFAAAVLILSPLDLSKNRKMHIYRLAKVASRVVPEGETVLNLDIYYWSLSNIFLFYSDRRVSYPVGDEEEFVRLLDGGRFGIVTWDDYDRIFSGKQGGYPIVARSRDMVLFKEGEPVPAILDE